MFLPPWKDNYKSRVEAKWSLKNKKKSLHSLLSYLPPKVKFSMLFTFLYWELSTECAYNKKVKKKFIELNWGTDRILAFLRTSHHRRFHLCLEYAHLRQMCVQLQRFMGWAWVRKGEADRKCTSPVQSSPVPP